MAFAKDCFGDYNNAMADADLELANDLANCGESGVCASEAHKWWLKSESVAGYAFDCCMNGC